MKCYDGSGYMLNNRNIGRHSFTTRGDDILLEPAMTGAMKVTTGNEGGD